LANNDEAAPQDRIRRTGGGRKKATVKQPGLVETLLELEGWVNVGRGDLMRFASTHWRKISINCSGVRLTDRHNPKCCRTKLPLA
jgi:hypothetical protein